MRYIYYDAKTVSAIINSPCYLRINSYEDSDRSVAIVLEDKKYNRINKELNSNTVLSRLPKKVYSNSFATSLFIAFSLFYITAVIGFLKIQNGEAIQIAFPLLLGILLAISMCTIAYFSRVIDSMQSSTLFIEGVGDHFDEDDINKVYEMHKSGKTKNKIHIEILKMIVKKDPAGVKPEFLEWYKDTLDQEKRYVEKRSEELGLLSSSLESGNKKPLSEVKKRKQVESEMNQWEAALSTL